MPAIIQSFEGDFAFLSNFFNTPQPIYLRLPCCFLSDADWSYAGVEFAYQAAKTTKPAQRWQVLMAPTPGFAKRLGRKLMLRADWDQIRLALMYDLLVQKFSQPVLGEMLLDTGETDLQEGNHWNDTFWGVCNAQGQNHLGRLLMRVRAEINTGRHPILTPTTSPSRLAGCPSDCPCASCPLSVTRSAA